MQTFWSPTAKLLPMKPNKNILTNLNSEYYSIQENNSKEIKNNSSVTATFKINFIQRNYQC